MFLQYILLTNFTKTVIIKQKNMYLSVIWEESYENIGMCKAGAGF